MVRKASSILFNAREVRVKTQGPTTATVRSPDGGIAKRTLVVCPLCVANQWKDEIEAKTPQLSVALYHGADRRERFSPAILASYDVVVTTYDILGHEKNESPMGSVFRVQWFRYLISFPSVHPQSSFDLVGACTEAALGAEYSTLISYSEALLADPTSAPKRPFLNAPPHCNRSTCTYSDSQLFMRRTLVILLYTYILSYVTESIGINSCRQQPIPPT